MSGAGQLSKTVMHLISIAGDIVSYHRAKAKTIESYIYTQHIDSCAKLKTLHSNNRSGDDRNTQTPSYPLIDSPSIPYILFSLPSRLPLLILYTSLPAPASGQSDTLGGRLRHLPSDQTLLYRCRSKLCRFHWNYAIASARSNSSSRTTPRSDP